MSEYVVETQIFQGPLELLLHLIEQEELDITMVSLAEVTGQYLDYLAHMPHREPAEMAAFLDVAVQLVWIKSQALLPRPPSSEEDEVGEDLVQQLREFQHYKQVSQQLQGWMEEGRRAFGRLASPNLPNPKLVELENSTLQALLQAMEERFRELAVEKPRMTIPYRRRITLRSKARRIHDLLCLHERVPFYSLLAEDPTREDVVVTLWAVLEMFKRHWIVFEQEELFGPINICRHGGAIPEWQQGAEWWAELEDLG
ncbi:MAG: segregation/condensation protein A [Chloroflexia bacterium]|nr:segregation/condensation protein A [Chloroflexia bacterium]